MQLRACLGILPLATTPVSTLAGLSLTKYKINSHVLHGDILEDLAVVDVPDGLVVPDLGGQQDSTQDDPLPVARADVDLRVGQEPLQVDLHSDVDEGDVCDYMTVTCMESSPS